MRGRKYDSIKAWRLADDLAVAIYGATEAFPKAERYGLVSQMRRACVSVPANIAEGASRFSQKEYLQFLHVARASLAEVRYYLHLTKRLGYLTAEEYVHFDGMGDEVSRVLYGLMKSVDGTMRHVEPPQLLSTVV